MRKILLSALFLLASTPVPAYYIWGIGEETCGSYIGAMAEHDHAGNTERHLAHLNWVKGFITGINWAKDSDIAKDLDLKTVRGLLDSYCRDNLDDDIAGAAAAVVKELEGKD